MSVAWPRYRWLRCAAAAACAVVLAGCGAATGTAADDVAAPQATPTDVTDAAADIGAAGPTMAGEDVSTLRGVAEGGGQLVVVGADDAGPKAWSVDDDGAWRPHSVTPEPGVAQFDAVALDGTTGIAFGGDDAGASRAWFTDDLRSWQLHDAQGIDGRVNAVTVGDRRWVAVGDRVDAGSGEAYEGVVWVSEDAMTFDVLADGLALAEGTVSDVAAADGTVVVVGFDVDGGKVWTSSDGGAFEAASGPFGAATIDGVAAADGGFVAMGRGLADLMLRAWTSTDGRRWEAVDVTSDLQPQDEVHDLATVVGGVTAVGNTADTGQVWTLRDGDLSPLEP